MIHLQESKNSCSCVLSVWILWAKEEMSGFEFEESEDFGEEEGIPNE